MRIPKLLTILIFAASIISAEDYHCLVIIAQVGGHITGNGLHASVGLTITNVSKHVISYWDANPDCDYSIFVLTGSGASAPETPLGKKMRCSGGPFAATGRHIPITLKPGESTEDTIDLTERYDMSAPGEYFVHVARDYPQGCKVKSNIAKYAVEAPK